MEKFCLEKFLCIIDEIEHEELNCICKKKKPDCKKCEFHERKSKDFCCDKK